MTKSGRDTRQISSTQSGQRNRRQRRKPEEALTDIIHRALALKLAPGVTALDAIIAQLTNQSLQNNKQAKRVLLRYHQRNIAAREPKITVIGQLL